jgi:hypothetical protein
VVTLFARFLGWSTSNPRRTVRWYASNCSRNNRHASVTKFQQKGDGASVGFGVGEKKMIQFGRTCNGIILITGWRQSATCGASIALQDPLGLTGDISPFDHMTIR